MRIVADLDRSDPSKTTLSFSEPSEIQGVTMICTEDSFRIQLLGLSFEVPEEYAPECALVRSLVEALDGVTGQEGERRDRFVFDDQSGVPISYALPEENATVWFSNWEVFDQE